MHVVGHDLRSQPVIYSVFSLAEDKEPETNKKHMIHQFETVGDPRAAALLTCWGGRRAVSGSLRSFEGQARRPTFQNLMTTFSAHLQPRAIQTW